MGNLFSSKRRSKDYEKGHSRRKSESDSRSSKIGSSEGKENMKPKSSRDEDTTKVKKPSSHAKRERRGSMHHSSSGKPRVRLQLQPSLSSLKSAPGQWPQEQNPESSYSTSRNSIAGLVPEKRTESLAPRKRSSLFGRSSSSRKDDDDSSSLLSRESTKTDRPSLYRRSSRRSARSTKTL
ncbi:hypothetical protein BDV97DRAFT_20876 [Delphinella strobiligena]|nr:hypothetical protein BDV97DRAFT_20876 [Delphinella strobiligena]